MGHAFSALTAWQAAQAAGGQFLLRIEDIDGPRCKPEFESQIYYDLQWLGLEWEQPVLRQSDRMEAYQAALQDLDRMGVIYPCSCTRGDIQAALSARQEGDADTQVYPGTCRGRTMATWQPGDAVRLNMKKALGAMTELSYFEVGSGTEQKIIISPDELLNAHGDVVLARKDIQTSYHLAVVVDDAAQGITHVTRGEDMADQTSIHILLQRLLGCNTPIYRHHKLIRDENGKRLAKRHDALAIKTLRQQGETPEGYRQKLGL